jgi:hypothetical protein
MITDDLRKAIHNFMGYLNAETGPSTGMTFIRNHGPAPKKGYQIIGFLSLIAVPDEQAAQMIGESISPTVAACAFSKDVIFIAISAGESKDVSRPGEWTDGSRGNGYDGIARQPIWRF